MKMAPDYLHLKGYRLPTEAEWEYACRAGAETDFAFGATDEILGQYGWYAANSTFVSHVEGLRKPNDWGLFDMHGNVWKFTQSTFKPYVTSEGAPAVEDSEEVSDLKEISKFSRRVIRGGSFYQPPEYARSGHRDVNNWYNPGNEKGRDVGFRVARTISAE
jgi:formylglycine-generating enzyme required for sulfatase activity